MNKDQFMSYARIRKRLNHLIFLGLDLKILGELVSSWTGVDEITGYKWVYLSHEFQTKKQKVWGGIWLLFLWLGAIGLCFLLFHVIGVVSIRSVMALELFILLSVFSLWIGLFGSIVYSKLRLTLM
jgi:hypothetical protein